MSEIPSKPEQIMIFDTTLRDGAQSPGISLTSEESLNIAQQLSRLGVDVIEAGFPISSPGNFEAVQMIAQQLEGPIIAGLARTQVGDIEAAAHAVADAERPRIHTFISTSDIHIKHQLRTSREDVKGQARAAVAQAKQHVDDVEFSPMDATRSDIEFTAEVCQIAIDEGATTINIPDTVGYTQPDEFRGFLTQLQELVPALGSVTLSVHCHDDLGLAVANSFAGVQAGARQVECAVNGLGERAGNAAVEEIVMLLRTRREKDGFDTGVVAELLGPTSRMVSRYTGYNVPKNKAVVGENAFQHESGIHQDGVLKDRSTFEIMSSESVGMDSDELAVDKDGITLGKQSGSGALAYVLEQEGVLKPRYLKPTFKLFKHLADRVGNISRDQIVEIHDEAMRRETSPYNSIDCEIAASSKTGVYSAEVVLVKDDGTEERYIAENSLDHHTDIDGPVAAIFTALDEATNTSYELEKYEVMSVGKRKETIGKTTVVLKSNGDTATGHGISLDTHNAAALAYLDAIKNANEQAASS